MNADACRSLRPLSLFALVGALVLIVAGCGRAGPPAVSTRPNGPKFEVVAAENFWGSIAAQLAGDKASVESIIVDPDADPHSYQPTAADARTIATANMTIVNGVGYDDWAQQLLQASAGGARVELDVGKLLRLPSGANPHRWYFPEDVDAVVDQIVRDYDRLDPADAAYFARQKQRFQTVALARYNSLRAQIRARYAGVAVGYSESIFQGLGENLGLDLLTPQSFTRAIAEGTDVTAKDKQTVDDQAREHRIKVWIFNSQNVTPDVKRVNQLVAEAHIPVATVTETLSPASDTFEQWQVSQLEGLQRALQAARLR
jgi:zinc/manganese transport system substrate-binding protein